MLIPTTLSDWTYEAIKTLCSAGQPESDRHDFKFTLAALKDAPKICCAFANTFGGFIVVGVQDVGKGQFDIVGLDADKELYGNFLAKVRAEPDIPIQPPITISIPDSAKLLYVLEIPRSPRRPHLPSPADQRVFWKRQGSACVQMTLEEIRYQMNTYEEKLEKLALLLIDLDHKVKWLNFEASLPDNQYSGNSYSFDIIDRVIVEAYAFLKTDVNIFRALDTIKHVLMHVNGEKQKLLTMLAMSYSPESKTTIINHYRETVKTNVSNVSTLAEHIERSLIEKFGIVNPYKAPGQPIGI